MKETKRYNLVIPMDMWEKLDHLAQARCVSVLAILRQFIRLGLLVTDEDETCQVILRRDGKDTYPLFL